MKDLTRRQLTQRLKIFNSERIPPKGWVHTIRSALEMSASQFARRLGVARSFAYKIESNEQDQSITLRTLEKAAQALECRLVYALVPKQTLDLDDILKDRAHKKALQEVLYLAHSMSLEHQSLSKEEIQEKIKKLEKDLLKNHPNQLWEDFDDAGSHD